MFLCETKLQSVQMNTVRNKLNFDSCFAVDSNGKGGGLAMLGILKFVYKLNPSVSITLMLNYKWPVESKCDV